MGEKVKGDSNWGATLMTVLRPQKVTAHTNMQTHKQKERDEAKPDFFNMANIPAELVYVMSIYYKFLQMSFNNTATAQAMPLYKMVLLLSLRQNLVICPC